LSQRARWSLSWRVEITFHKIHVYEKDEGRFFGLEDAAAVVWLVKFIVRRESDFSEELGLIFMVEELWKQEVSVFRCLPCLEYQNY
jgi:hypothetical protein